MKPGFWIAPEGDDAPIAMLPIGDGEIRKNGLTGAGALSFLATSDAEAMVARCPGVSALLPRLVDALRRQTATAPGILFDLAELGPEEIGLIGESFGAGEVSAVVALPNGVMAQVRESVLAGLWRVRFENAEGAVIADYAEVSAIPQVIRRAAAMTLPGFEVSEAMAEGAPEGTMNVMPVLAEIADRVRRRRPGDEPHTISITLLPMTPDDVSFLQETLGVGPVRIFSRGYGSCRIQATAIHGVWSVQFFNSTDAILLDTIEICDVPIVACAAEEDFRDSADRLSEIRDAYFQ